MVQEKSQRGDQALQRNGARIMPRIIDCINDYDSFWAHNGKSIFVFETDELSPYETCLAAIERGFNQSEGIRK